MGKKEEEVERKEVGRGQESGGEVKWKGVPRREWRNEGERGKREEGRRRKGKRKWRGRERNRNKEGGELAR